jgi:hypothetical protein
MRSVPAAFESHVINILSKLHVAGRPEAVFPPISVASKKASQRIDDDQLLQRLFDSNFRYAEYSRNQDFHSAG